MTTEAEGLVMKLVAWANDWPAWDWSREQNAALKVVLADYARLKRERDEARAMAANLSADITALGAAFQKGVEAMRGAVVKVCDEWRDENRAAASDAGRHGDRSMRDRLDGSATECHALSAYVAALPIPTAGDAAVEHADLCEGCPPARYPDHPRRCAQCPRRPTAGEEG